MSAGSANTPVTDFTSLDFWSVQSDLVAFAQRVFPAELWTDFNESNPDTFRLQLMAYATELVAYNMNAEILETLPTTVIREANFRRIAAGADYSMKSASASAGTVRCTLDTGGSYPFTISQHLQFSTADGVVFQPTASVSVTSASPAYVDVPTVQGQEFYQEAQALTTGQSGQVVQIVSANVIDGTLQVSVGLNSYSKITNFVTAGPTDRVYTTTVTEKGFTQLIFGDGINGVIPPRGQQVTATYKIGGGISTNVTANTIKQLFGTSDGSAIPAQIVSVTNPAGMTGGGAKQTLANAKQNLPESLKANERAVSVQDFAAETVRRVAGVSKAMAVPGVYYGGSSPILLFVVPNGGGNPSDVLKNQIQVGLRDAKSPGKRVRVKNPIYVNLLIDQELFVQANSPASDVANRMRTALATKYGLDAVDFGDTFSLQDAYDSVGSTHVQGVSRVFYRQFSVEPYAARHVSKPSTGNGSVEGIAVNWGTVKRREWLIRVIPANPPTVLVNRFQVLQRMLGTVTFVTDTLVTDESANYDANSLLTWVLHPNPESDPTTFAITANTDTTISTAAGLLVGVEPEDPYVVEKTDSVVGKILRTTLLADVSGATLNVASSSGFVSGDLVRVSKTGEVDRVTTVSSVPDSTHVILDTTVTATAGSYLDFYWRSDDGSVGFSVVDAPYVATPPAFPALFVVGDELYVDTFEKSGDIYLRAETFPELTDSNLVITTVGGVK